MARHVLAVLSNPTDGNDDEYNAWYDDTHLADVLTVPGFVAARRFALAAPVPGQDGPAQRYLAIYEVESDDLPGAIHALIQAGARMDISPTYDLNSTVMWSFTELASKERDAVAKEASRA